MASVSVDLQMRPFFTFALLLAVFAPAYASGLSPLEARLGVWRGTVGTHSIMACLQRANSGAAYYYVEHGLSIALSPEPDTDGTTWSERTNDGTESGTWALDKAQDNTLIGWWSDATGKRTLPIHLTRVVAPGDPGNACGSGMTTPARRAFDAPRIDAQTVKIEPWSAHERKLSALDGKITAIELLDDAPNAKAFNATIREWVRDQIAGYYDCLSSAPQGDFSEELEIQWRADPWIVMREIYQADCGGAHPSRGITSWVWNLAERKRIEPWRWIVTIGKSEDCPYLGCEQQPTDELNDLIVAAATRNKGGDECSDSVNEYRKYGFYQLRPSAGGLVFSTDFPYAAQACDEDIEIPWKKLEPFLSVQGRKAMRTIRQAASAKPGSE